VISNNNLGMFRITRQKAGQNPKVKKNRNYNLRDYEKKGKLEKKEDRWIIYMW